MFIPNNKVVGAPCPLDGTPYSQGPKGVYCKTCYMNWKNSEGQQPIPNNQYIPQRTQYQQPAQLQPVQQEKPDWDAIAKGKVRHGFAIEAFKLGLDLSPNTRATINLWVDYVVNGEKSGVSTPLVQPIKQEWEFPKYNQQQDQNEVRLEDIPF